MNVIIYSTSTCPYCIMLKNFLKMHNVEFTDYDVSKNQDKAKEMVDKSKQKSVPVIDIDGDVFVGFDKVKISEKLGIKL